MQATAHRVTGGLRGLGPCGAGLLSRPLAVSRSAWVCGRKTVTPRARQQGPAEASPVTEPFVGQPEASIASIRPEASGRPIAAFGQAALAGAAVLAAAFPGSSSAMEAAPAPGVLQALLDFIEGLGPLGPAVYTALVACCELVPLFPTQPLSLASGLLFGAQKGALCMCIGTTLAAAGAFGIARGVGRPLAERLIQWEVHELEEAGIGGEPGTSNSLETKLQHVKDAIEHGSFWKQAGAIFLLRLTPVVPFSASNYVLGLTPLPMMPYMAGTAAGMGCWSVVYASLGGASRSLLERGVSADVLLADLLERTGEYTHEVAVAALVAGVAAAGAWGADTLRKSLAASQTGGSGDAGSFPASPLRLPAAGTNRKLVEQMEES